MLHHCICEFKTYIRSLENYVPNVLCCHIIIGLADYWSERLDFIEEDCLDICSWTYRICTRAASSPEAKNILVTAHTKPNRNELPTRICKNQNLMSYILLTRMRPSHPARILPAIRSVGSLQNTNYLHLHDPLSITTALTPSFFILEIDFRQERSSGRSEGNKVATRNCALG